MAMARANHSYNSGRSRSTATADLDAFMKGWGVVKAPHPAFSYRAIRN